MEPAKTLRNTHRMERNLYTKSRSGFNTGTGLIYRTELGTIARLQPSAAATLSNVLS